MIFLKDYKSQIKIYNFYYAKLKIYEGSVNMSIIDFIKKSKNTNNTTETITSINETSNNSEKLEVREFDLNIEKILENWEVFHAIREIIANALDEQIITKTNDISIFKSKDSCWHIVDYGRGLNYHHLTQNENEEKLKNNKLIGRFGVGLKDALATLYRHNIKVKISSKYGIITLKQTPKAGFEDIVTLHADILKPDDKNMIGTDFCLQGCKDEDIEKAKLLFLKFSKNEILESTVYGDVIDKENASASIYINGVKVAEEPNFLFSYNITSITSKLKKALNRERTNVGRTAYTDRIKAILLECKKEKVIKMLVDDLQKFEIGTKHDELNWQDIQLYVSKQLRKLQSNSTFITSEDLQFSQCIIDEMKRGGYNPIIIPSSLANKMEDYNKYAKDGETFKTTGQFIEDEKVKFKPTIIEIDELTSKEKNIYKKTNDILRIIGGKPEKVEKIQIAEKIYVAEHNYITVGLWQPEEGRILIKRSQLQSLDQYAGTLLHECCHAKSGADDINRDFENELTNMLGILAAQLI